MLLVRNLTDELRIQYIEFNIVAKLSVGIQKLLMKNEGDKGCIMVPVNLRQELLTDEPFSTANLSLPLFIPLAAGKHESHFSGLLLKQLQERRFVARGRSDSMYRSMSHSFLSWTLQKLWRHQLDKGKYIVSAVVSHTGLHPRKALSTSHFAADRVSFVPGAIPIAPLSLVITENESTTDICIVKGRSVWASAQELLEQVITLSDLKSEFV